LTDIPSLELNQHQRRLSRIQSQLFAQGIAGQTLVASLDTHRREELHRDFIDFHNEFLTELGIALTRTYLITVGTRR
jgi:hypothetical protein